MRLWWIGFILLIGCAEKKYVRGVEEGGGRTKPGALECTARFENSGACLSHTWEQTPKAEELLSFTFKIWRANKLDGTPVLMDFNHTIEVELWMPAHGHGSSPVTVDNLDIGTLRANEVYFSMTGDWIVRVKVMNGANEVDKAVLKITI